MTPREHVEAAVAAAKAFRAGDRPWVGQRRAGTPEARGEKPAAARVPTAAETPDEPREAMRITHATVGNVQPPVRAQA